jgi:hypothetical protein
MLSAIGPNLRFSDMGGRNENSVCGLIFLLLFGLHSMASGEVFNSQLELGSLNIPDSPAFEVLGVSPSSVSRPGSARELAVSLFSSSLKQDSTFPRNLAVEFSPYWWSYHPELTWKTYNPEGENIGNNILQTFTVSLATSKTTSTINSIEVDGTGAGLGFRTSLLKGKPSKKGQLSYDAVKKVMQENVDAIIPDDISTLPKDANGNRIIDLEKIADPAAFKKIQVAVDDFRKANLNRVGWRLELASAASIDFPQDKSSGSKMKSAGAWLTTTYRTDEGSFLDHFDFLGVFRYLSHNADVGSFPTYDIGGRIIWISANDNLPLSASAEYVYRFVSKGDLVDTKKISFIAEYRVDKTWSLFASLGQAFDPNFKSKENFVSLFGINFGYGKGPVVSEKQ